MRCIITEKIAEAGDTVKFDFVGTFEDGSVFDTSDNPVAIEIGTGKLIKGLDSEILGMAEGDEKKVEISPEEGYGVEDPNLVINIPNEAFQKNNLEPKVGMMIKTSKGTCHVTQVFDKDIEVNFNHPLAGKNLTFDIKIVEIVKK